MNDSFDDLSMIWKDAKHSKHPNSDQMPVAELIRLGNTKKKSTMMAHVSAIIVMSATATIIAYFLGYRYPYHTTLGKFAVYLMVGVLALRVVIELFSIYRSRQIRVEETTAASLERSLAFLKFRKGINGPVTYTALAVYLIGFNLLLPELSIYLTTKAIILLDLSAFIIVGIITYFIIRGTKKEIGELNKLVQMQRALSDQ